MLTYANITKPIQDYFYRVTLVEIDVDKINLTI